jgi:hypothetical protein
MRPVPTQRVMVPRRADGDGRVPGVGRITSRAGDRTTLLLGAAVVAAGCVLGAPLHAGVWHVVLGTVVIRAGVGPAHGPCPP